jgi:hypothetical protein
MAFLRLAAVLIAIGIAGCVAAFWLSGDRKYLRYALRTAQTGLVAALVFFAVLAVERLA